MKDFNEGSKMTLLIFFKRSLLAIIWRINCNKRQEKKRDKSEETAMLKVSYGGGRNCQQKQWHRC